MVSESLANTAFRTKWAAVWDGLMALPKSSMWSETIEKMPAEVWYAPIARYTIPHDQDALASDIVLGEGFLVHPRPFILELPSHYTLSSVYTWILKPEQKTEHVPDNNCYVHIASHCESHSTIARKIFELQHMVLSLPGDITPLLELPVMDDTEADLQKVGALVRIAEVVFTIWLRAVKAESKALIPD